MKPVRVCLVEDDRSIRSSMKDILEIEGYEVVDFENASLAVDYLTSGEKLPHILFLDLMMPVMNGWEFLKLAANKNDWKMLPVVVFSATNQSVSELYPAVAYYPKPIDVDSFLVVLEKHRRRDV